MPFKRLVIANQRTTFISDETFYEICRPNFDLRDHLTLEEDKLKIIWCPADIERWLQTGKRSSSTQRAIEIDSYEVTIFPAESVKNTHTLPALSRQVGNLITKYYNNNNTLRSTVQVSMLLLVNHDNNSTFTQCGSVNFTLLRFYAV